jgi:hypothetical protein
MSGLIRLDPEREPIEAFRGNIEDGTTYCGLPTPAMISCDRKRHGERDKSFATARLAIQDAKRTLWQDSFDKPIRLWERR